MGGHLLSSGCCKGAPLKRTLRVKLNPLCNPLERSVSMTVLHWHTLSALSHASGGTLVSLMVG